MFPANVAVWGHDEIWMSVLRWVGGLPCEVCSLSLRWEEAALNIFTARQRAASFTSPLGMCANSKRLCLSTAIPKKQCQWNMCKRGCFCVVEKSPRVPADLRATIKHQDFTVTGPQRSVEHQKKKKKKCHVLKQEGRLSGKDRQKNVTWGRPAAVPRAYASRKGLNTAPWICEFCVKCLTTKGPPHHFWWRRSACICTRVYQFFLSYLEGKKSQKQLILLWQKHYKWLQSKDDCINL